VDVSHDDELAGGLPDPFDPDANLDHPSASAGPGPAAPPSLEAALERKVETAVVRAVFGGSELRRRSFMRLVGASTAGAIFSSVFPLRAAAAALLEESGPPEKPELAIGFIPITCATPIIMAEPLGFYAKHKLNATVRRASGWAMIRDWAITKEVDAAHMLSPMPLAITLGAGSQPVPFYMPAIENVNGQAITLHVKHKGVKSAADMKGFRFCVPFDYSMHNYLLRYYLAEGGLHPDTDVQIRVVPPPEMVANLKAENVDGYLAPDPFNQRAVYENVGFIHLLSKDIWDRHPCCAFAVSQSFASEYPNTFRALFKSIVEATSYAAKPENRKEIAAAIAPRNYLNQPEVVLEQVLTGKFADGTGKVQNVPDRIDFDPFPWQSMAIWILTQMKRWKQIEGEIDYAKVAQQVYLAADCDAISAELGLPTKGKTMQKHVILGKTFDPAEPAEYLARFAIRSA
jgi:nitrate/nitrite transport system substrate-binding protein